MIVSCRQSEEEAVDEVGNDFECSVFLLVARTIMGPHGINRAVQRLEFCDCKRGLGERPPPLNV